MTFTPLTSERLAKWDGALVLDDVRTSIEYYEQQIAGLIKAYDRAKADTKQAEAAHARLRTALNTATAETRTTKLTRGEWFLPRWCTSLLENGEVIAYVGSRDIDAFVRDLNGRMDVVAAWKARALGAEENSRQYHAEICALQEELEDRREIDRQIREILGLSDADTGTLGTISAVRALIEQTGQKTDQSEDAAALLCETVSIIPRNWPYFGWEFRPLSDVTLQDDIYVVQLRTGEHQIAIWHADDWVTAQGEIPRENPVCFVAAANLYYPLAFSLTPVITINDVAFTRSQLVYAIAELDLAELRQKNDEIAS